MTVSALTFTHDLLEGFALLLAGDVASPFTYSDTADYASDQLGLWLGPLPLDKPDRAVALMTYPLSADPTLSQAMTGVQFRSRGSRDGGVFDVMGIDDAIQNALGGRFPVTLPNGIRVPSLVWTSGTSLGQDDSHRWEWSTNFVAGVGRPGAHRH